jgi:hypothetical protein
VLPRRSRSELKFKLLKEVFTFLQTTDVMLLHLLKMLACPKWVAGENGAVF